MADTDWQVFAIEVDGGVEQIARSIEKFYGLKINRIKVDNADELKEIDKDELLKKLKGAGVPQNYSERRKCLFILGDGDYHHLTHALTRLSGKKNYALFDWDSHTDDYRDVKWSCGLGTKQVLACDQFTDLLTEDCGAASVTYLGFANGRFREFGGVDEPAFKQSRWASQSDLKKRDVKDITKELAVAAEGEDAYITIDLDVLDPSEHVSVYFDYAVGSMKIDELVDSVRTVGGQKDYFACDVVGYHAGATRLVRKKSVLAATVLAGEVMGLDSSRAYAEMREVDLELSKQSLI